MKIVIVAVLFLQSFSLTSAQEPLTAAQQNVQQVITHFFQTIAERDTTRMLSYCTSDILVLENALLWTRDTLSLKLAQNTAEDYKRINTIAFIRTTVKGKVAWVSYHNEAEIDRNGKHSKVRWLETAILVRKGKEWKISILHSTLIERT